MIDPVNQRSDPVCADIPVFAIKFSGTSDTEPIVPQATRHEFGFIIKQTDRGRTLLANRVLQCDCDGVALDGVNVQSIPNLGRKIAAFNSSADYDVIKFHLIDLAVFLKGHRCTGSV